MKRRHLAPVLGVISFVGVALSGQYERCFTAAHHPKEQLFDTLATFASLMIAILLGMLAVLLTLGSKQIIQVIRASQRDYLNQLVDRGWRPLVAFIVVATLCIVGLSINNDDSVVWRFIVGTGVFSLSTAGIIDTYQFSKLLVDSIKDKDFGQPAEQKTFSHRRSTDEPEDTSDVSVDDDAHS